MIFDIFRKGNCIQKLNSVELKSTLKVFKQYHQCYSYKLRLILFKSTFLFFCFNVLFIYIFSAMCTDKQDRISSFSVDFNQSRFYQNIRMLTDRTQLLLLRA